VTSSPSRTGVDELVAFLRERLGEDERVARACLAGPWMTGTQAGFRESDRVDIGRIIYGRTWAAHGDEVRPEFDKWGQVANLEMAWKHEEHLAHIARHDPARVLREVEAKRKLVDIHGSGNHDCPGAWVGYCDDPDEPCPTLRLLVSVYATHPDYRPEWQPS